MILGIDGTNWCHVLWHAAGRNAEAASLAVTFARRVGCLVEFLQPSHAVVCWDRRSFRAELEPHYKADRKPKDDGLRMLLDLAPREQTGAQQAYQDGYEADDCLATLAAIGVKTGDKTVLATPDKDLRQCLRSGCVNLLRSYRLSAGKVTEPDWYTAEKLQAEYGLRPDQWRDFQALVGDPTDGIEGCKGWGKVTTCKVLTEFGTLGDCLRNPGNVPVTARQRDALFAFRSRADTVRQLVTLSIDVDAVYDAMR